MNERRRAELRNRVRLLNNDVICTLLPMPDPPREWFESGHTRAFTRISGHVGELIRIAEEALS